MNVGAYLKGAKRGDFQWECIESGGEGLSVDVEETELEKRYATIRRYNSKTYIAEVTLIGIANMRQIVDYINDNVNVSKFVA